MTGATAAQHYPHQPVRPAWLALRHEAALEPALPIIDPHHHLWRGAAPYLLDELLADLRSGHAIRGTVFLQCGSEHRSDGDPALRPVGETEFVAALATAAARAGRPEVCQGIVGFADCRLGTQIDAVLEAHLAAGGTRFKGIRHGATYDAAIAPTNAFAMPEHLYLDPTFQRGVQRLGHLGLSFDAWLYHPQLPELGALARAAADVPIVINHLGGPLGVGPYQGRRDQVFSEWRAQIRALAHLPNLFIKLGGLSMTISGFDWHSAATPPTSTMLAEAWRPYIETASEAFGTERCMFESNFPVDKAMSSYAVVWNAFKRLAASCPATQKADLFHATAQRFYRLPALAPASAGGTPAAFHHPTGDSP